MKRGFMPEGVVGKPLRWFVIAILIGTASTHAAEPALAEAGADPYKQLPLRRDAEPMDLGWRMLIGLGVLAVAGAFVVVRAKKGGPLGRRGGLLTAGWGGKTSQTIEIVEKQSLSAACNLYVVRWDSEEILLACNPNEIAVVSRRPVGPSGGRGAA